MRGVQLTKGHLSSNGGLRGHSVGDSFPFIVFAKGTFDSLKWCVRAPNGDILEDDLTTANQAEHLAYHYKTVRELLTMH